MSDADKLISDEKKTESLLVPPSTTDLLMVPEPGYGSPGKKGTGFDSDTDQDQGDWDERDKRKQ